MSFLRRFFPSAGAPAPFQFQSGAGSVAEVEMVRAIIARIDNLPPERARFIACAAYVIARAASADAQVSDEAAH